MTHNERRLAAVEKQLGEKVERIKAIWKTAEDDGARALTEDEATEVEQLLTDSEQLKADRKSAQEALRVEREVADTVRDLGKSRSAVEPEGKTFAQPRRPETPGDIFLKSEGFKRVKAEGFPGNNWTTGDIDIEAKALLVEGDNLFLDGGTPGEGAALVPLDQRQGVMPILFQSNRVANLFASGTTDSNAINYIVETVADSGAAVVPEGGAKPESTLEFSNEQEAVKKVATFLPVSDEMLEDAGQLRSYINARLSLFVENEVDVQLLHGAGGSNFRGIMPRVPVANRYVTSGAASPNAADHIYEAITVARRSFLEPDGIVMNPEDWADLRLLKDDNDNYIGGSPFANTGVGEPGESLWSKRVVLTYAMTQGAALVGAFGTGGQVFSRGGLRVEASNSHADYFVHNQTAIRAERRLALAVYRPQAFAIADIGYAS